MLRGIIPFTIFLTISIFIGGLIEEGDLRFASGRPATTMQAGSEPFVGGSDRAELAALSFSGSPSLRKWGLELNYLQEGK
jgi:hypothetical protein